MEGFLSRLLDRSKVERAGGHHSFQYKTLMRVNIAEYRDNISEHVKIEKSVKRLSQAQASSSAEGGAVDVPPWFWFVRCTFIQF